MKTRGTLNVNSSKYDKPTIITDYKNGLSLSDLHKKHGISQSYAADILRKSGDLRSISEGQVISKKHQVVWRKLCRIPKKNRRLSPTRIVSIPWEILSRLGFNSTSQLIGRWKVHGDSMLILEIKERKGEITW